MQRNRITIFTEVFVQGHKVSIINVPACYQQQLHAVN